MEKRNERMQAALNESEMQIHAIKESIKGQQMAIDGQMAKMRDLNEVLYKIDNVQIPALNTRLSQMMTRDEFVVFKKEHDLQVIFSSYIQYSILCRSFVFIKSLDSIRFDSMIGHRRRRRDDAFT